MEIVVKVVAFVLQHGEFLPPCGEKPELHPRHRVIFHYFHVTVSSNKMQAVNRSLLLYLLQLYEFLL